MDVNILNQQLLAFLSRATSPFHAVEAIRGILEDTGFTELRESDDWQIESGVPRFIIRDDGSILAFNIGSSQDQGFRMLGTHSDSPALQIKPHPDIYEKSFHKLGVEVYGGALLLPWFDRELSIAGRVTYRNAVGEIFSDLIDFARPVAIIPSVALHLDRKANSEKSVNAQRDIIPIIGLPHGAKRSLNEFVSEQLDRQHPDSQLAEILATDLYLYDPQKPCLAGMDNEFILSGRLDNLLSSFVGTMAAAAADRRFNFVFVCNNHEEVGSGTASGAQGNMLVSFFERLFNDNSRRHRILAESFFISLDNAHGTHPNFQEKHDPEHSISLNKGPVLKLNASQKYASASYSSAIFKLLCREAGVQVQEFVMRNDLLCGSTIGPITAAKLGLKTVDVGAPSLAMHSIRELTGSQDPGLLLQVIMHYLQCDKIPTVNRR